MTAPPLSPADRWEALVRSGLSEATATAMVRREMAGRPSLMGRAMAALNAPAPAPAPTGIEATLRAASKAPMAGRQQAMAKAQESLRPTLGSTAANLFMNNVPALVMPQQAAEMDQRLLDEAAQAGVDVSKHAGLLGAAAAGGDVTGNLLVNKAIPATAPLKAGMTAPQVATNLGKAGLLNYGVGAGLTGLAGGDLAEMNRSGLIQGALGTAFHGLAGAPVIRSIGPKGEAGLGATPIMSGITGGVVGGSVGYASGDTPEEKRKRGIIGALTGLGVGIAGGVAAERIGKKVNPPTVEPLPPRGNTPAEEYAKLSTFALDPTGEARLRDIMERAGPLHRGDPKTVEPMETVRVIAQSLGLDDVLKGDAERLDRFELLASRNIVHTNIDDIVRAVHKISDPLTPQAEREQLSMLVAGLEQQSLHLADRFTVARSETARNLNALKMAAARTLDPIYWLSKAQSVRGSLGIPDEMRTAIFRALGEKDRPALIKTIMDGRASTLGEKATTYWKANLLSNPATHIVNISSNALLGGLEMAKAGPAYVADRLMQLATHQATQGGYSRSMGRASMEGARRGLAGAIRTIKTGVSPADLGKFDVPKQTNYSNPILQAYTQSIFRTLGAEDQVFREAALSSSLANQAEAMARMEGWTGDVRAARVAELRTKPSDEMVVRAVQDAEEAVVRDQTAIGNILSAVNREGGVLGQVAVPFARTPGAVATRMGEYSPIGLTVGSVKTARVMLRGMQKMDVPPDVQREAAKILGRGATGSALMALGFYLASKGLATGPGDKDQSTWATQVVTGKMPTSVRLGNQWLEVGRLNPVGNLIAMGAFLHDDIFKSEEPVTASGAASSLLAATARTVMDQPFLTGIQNVLGELALDKQTAGRFAESVVSGMIPASALLSAVARGRDHTQRQTPGMAGYLQSRLPGVGPLEGSEGLAPQIDAFGQPKQRQGGPVEQMFNPSRRTKDKSADPVVRAMLDNGIKVTELRIKAGETPEQFAARAVAEGKRAYENVLETVRSPEFAAAPRAERQRMFRKAFDDGRRWGLNGYIAP